MTEPPGIIEPLKKQEGESTAMQNGPLVVGTLSPRVIELLGLSLQPGQDIMLGITNVAHMQSRHPEDYARYGQYIPQILAAPDYVGQNPNDGSIEYVKEFQIDNAFVKVAVRVSAKGRLFARSLYRLQTNRVNNFISKGTLKKY